MPTINTTHSILFVRSFHHHLFTLSKRTHYIIRSISQVIISVLSELITLEVLQSRVQGGRRGVRGGDSRAGGGPGAATD